MALIKCPECRNRVSETAAACPKCGFAVAEWVKNEEKDRLAMAQEKAERKQKYAARDRKFVGIAFAVIIGLLVLLGIMPEGTEEPGAPIEKTSASSAVKISEDDNDRLDAPYMAPVAESIYTAEIGCKGCEFINQFKEYTPYLVKVAELQRMQPQCAKVTSVLVSQSKSTPGNPVFFASCSGHSGDPYDAYNTWYTVDQVDNQQVANYIEVDLTEASRWCADSIKANASYPSSVDIAHVLGTATWNYPDGAAGVKMEFTAKNGIGNEIPYVAECYMAATGSPEINIYNR